MLCVSVQASVLTSSIFLQGNHGTRAVEYRSNFNSTLLKCVSKVNFFWNLKFPGSPKRVVKKTSATQVFRRYFWPQTKAADRSYMVRQSPKHLLNHPLRSALGVLQPWFFGHFGDTMSIAKKKNAFSATFARCQILVDIRGNFDVENDTFGFFSSGENPSPDPIETPG